MWVRLWIAFSVSTAVLSQHSSTGVRQSGSGYQWGWQLTPGAGVGNVGAVGQYYVKLPQSEQRVLYSADGSGYHGATALNASTHSSSSALGQKATGLYGQQAEQYPQQNLQQAAHANGNAPVDVLLLQQQYSPINPMPFALTTPASALQFPHYYYRHLTPLYNIQTQHPVRNNDKSGPIKSSMPLNKEAKTEQTPVVQVFKDHNCSDDKKHSDSKELESDLKKSKDLFAAVPSSEWSDFNGNFGAKNMKPLTYRGQVSFRVEKPKPNVRNERFYYTTEEPSYIPLYNKTQEGINRLVASTQDLITNEDLLRINDAIEQHLRDQSDDLIKTQEKVSVRNQHENNHETLYASPTMITVQAKIANILKGEIEHTEDNPVSEKVLQSNSKEYKFSKPIVVAEAPDNSFNKQIFDSVVSTMVPYLNDGYEVVGIKNSPQENQYDNRYNENRDSQKNMINLPPRPIGASYLAPITVALRLLNSNENETFNYVDDHEAADSELVTDTVANPNDKKTVVEIQDSIPLAITHINEVEFHEYLDEGRSNNKGSYGFAKNLFDNYVQSVRSSNKLQDNLNKILLYNIDSTNSQENSYSNQSNGDDSESKEQLESSENIESHVEITPNGENNPNNQRSELINYYDENDNDADTQKLIQPIIIEKEVPVTKFIDRYIEKQVPYTETVTVAVPVDRPVPYAVQVEKVVEKPVQVTKYVDKPYPVEVPRPYAVEVKVPYPVQQKVYVDRPVHVPYAVEKVVEKQVIQPVAVPTPVEVPVEVPFPVEQKVLYPFPVDRPVPVHVQVEKPVDRIVEKQVPVPYPVEKRVPYPVHFETKVPVPYPVEKRIPVPVDRIVEKPVTVTKVVEKPVHIHVPVPHPVPVHIHHPYPVDRIVEKRVPYPVHVERIVEKKVNVPYPVEKVIETIVEHPVMVTRYVDKPYPVPVNVPYPVEKIVEKKVPYAVQVPVELKTPYHAEKPNMYEVAYRYGYRHGEADETRDNPQYSPLDQNQLKKRHYQQLKLQYEQYMKEQKNKKSLQPVQSNQWGNHYASSFQYINTSEPDIRQQNHNSNQAIVNYINYITNKQNQNPYSVQNQRPHQFGHNQGKSQHNDHDSGENQYIKQNQFSTQNQDENQYGSQHQGQNKYGSQTQGQHPYNSQNQIQNQGQNQHNSQRHGQNQIQNLYSSQEQNSWDKNKSYLIDVKVRRTDRVPKVTIEYGGFRPPMIPSTEVDLDGVPVHKSE